MTSMIISPFGFIATHNRVFVGKVSTQGSDFVISNKNDSLFVNQ